MTSTPSNVEKKKPPVRACVLCNQFHQACDSGRPCRRCVSKGISHLCRDTEPRKRGRPAKHKLPEQDSRQASKKQDNFNNYSPNSQMPQHSVSMEVPAPPNIMTFWPSSYNALLSETGGFEVESASFSETQNNIEYESLNNMGNVPHMQSMPVLSTEFMMQQPASSPNPSAPPTPQTPLTPDSYSPHPIRSQTISPTPTVSPEAKFSESQQEMFMRLATRVGYSAITAEMKIMMTKLSLFYGPLIQQYGSNIAEMGSMRLLNVTQMTNEMALPVVVANSFRVLNANSAAFSLTGLKKALSSNTYYVFDIIHKDDAVNFVRASIDCLVNYCEFDRMKVRLTTPTGEIQCVVSETTHRSQNGIPLFSTFTFVRIDDLLS